MDQNKSDVVSDIDGVSTIAQLKANIAAAPTHPLLELNKETKRVGIIASMGAPQRKPGVKRNNIDVDKSTNVTNEEDTGSKYAEMLMRHLPDGSLLHKIIDATSKELWDGPLPVLFGTKFAIQVSPELFCRSCKVHLGMWDAFHGNIIETGDQPPVRVCSNNCLMKIIDQPPIPSAPPTAFADDYGLYEEELKTEYDCGDEDDDDQYEWPGFGPDLR